MIREKKEDKMPNAQMFSEYTNRLTNPYTEEIENVDVKPEEKVTSHVIWITDDSVPMNVLLTLAKTKSPEIVESKLDYK